MDLIRWSGLVGIANWKLSASASAGIFSPGWEAEEKELFRLGRGNRNWGRFRNKKEKKGICFGGKIQAVLEGAASAWNPFPCPEVNKDQQELGKKLIRTRRGCSGYPSPWKSVAGEFW